MSSGYDERPWLRGYRPGHPPDLTVEFASVLEMFEAAVQRAPDHPIVHYFDGTLTVRQVDEQSDALAVALLAEGFRPGDRLGVYLQNIPQFVIAMVATWKAGGIVVSINPMNRERELEYLLNDSGATVLVCLEDLFGSVARQVLPSTSVTTVITTSELEYQTRHDARLFEGMSRTRHEGTLDLGELVGDHLGATPPPVSLAADDVAFLTYTSGTTGIPKGAMNTHRNAVFTSQVYREWLDLGEDDVILGVAPLFHITGLIANITTALLVPAPLVLAYRFEPNVVLDAIREHRPTFTVGAITVFIALMNQTDLGPDDVGSLTKLYSGGAAIAPAVVEAFERRTGVRIHTVYGLTETTSPSHAVPLGAAAPVDPASGALSVGLPVFDTVARIVDDEGRDLPVGDAGEIVIEGPQIVAGYWGKPEETASSIPGGKLHTGDVGFMDADGWFYIVDRKKDMINASGYKVWPREVEDVLYGHEAVREAAVVGVPDAYRGETVKAYVSLKAGSRASGDELVQFCKARMAAYKYPRSVEIVDELPKTVTGKILRRELRDR